MEINIEDFQLTNRILCNILLDISERNVKKIYHYFYSNYNLNDVELDKLKKYIVTSFMPVFEQKLKCAFYTKSRFEIQHKDWLDSIFSVKELKRGRKKSEGDDVSDISRSSKWRRINDIRQTYSDAEIQQAFITSLRSNGQIMLANKINILLSTDDDEAGSSENINDNDEILALIQDTKMTKFQYETLRSFTISKNVNIFPAYRNLSEAKIRCYPLQATIKIEERGAEVDLQSLLDHTINRIVKTPNVKLLQISRNRKGCLRFTAKWGCDGASGQSKYAQHFKDVSLLDDSIFMISLVPLKLESKTSSGWEEVWKNIRPSSTKFCRPIKFEYARETQEKIRSDVSKINDKIKSLIPYRSRDK